MLGQWLPNPRTTLCRNLPQKIGNALTEEQYKEVKELGILVDRDDQAGALSFSPAIYVYTLNQQTFNDGIRLSHPLQQEHLPIALSKAMQVMFHRSCREEVLAGILSGLSMLACRACCSRSSPSLCQTGRQFSLRSSSALAACTSRRRLMAVRQCWSKQEVVVALAKAISQSFLRALRTMSGHLTSIEAMRQDHKWRTALTHA